MDKTDLNQLELFRPYVINYMVYDMIRLTGQEHSMHR